MPKKKKKYKGKCYIIRNEIYPFDVMVSVDESDEKLLNRLLNYGNTAEDCAELMNMADTVAGRCVMLPSNQTVIRFRTQPTRQRMMAVAAHEIFHATAYLMGRIGMRLELGNSDEAYAYYVGFLTEKIFKILKL